VSQPTRPVYWTIRRELWENRSVLLAPLAVAALIFFGFLLSTLAGHWQRALALDPVKRAASLATPYNLAEGLLMGTMLFVEIFYCLDALYSERRDRSILFWKSLPLSDTMTVFSKAAIPFVILPLFTWAVTVITEIMMLLLSSAALLVRGKSVVLLWTSLPWLTMWGMLLHHLVIVHSLWYAPLFAWLLFVSAVVRRAPIVWAALPIVAIPIVEKMAFGTSHVAAVMMQHASGGDEGQTVFFPKGQMMMHHLGEFLIAPSFWIGLILAAILLVATVRVRRYRGPI
jgi:ABC-2 type transport system permease protein